MIVYHGSLEKIKQPEIREPNRNLDYGGGFYATTSEAQATDWVRRRMVDQYLFHTPKSLQAIKFHDAKQIKL